ncbi:ABC transporter substrate-binding protein [Chitinasiproducens palmae]|uniref:Putative spermidine/putrescine transport system substrate-binding protein n=1 Tax=Chitinasiproducens palmae TaxID=1770053 RepID=A0A1H2PQF3_9BURK|nr:ABC transporter substrate-binding protein [Chitinasiproducens palmae]SDV48979.1 putative spermidine/putrescine transport system substrate-binding protein [Chitinasiproducens palmae]
MPHDTNQRNASRRDFLRLGVAGAAGIAMPAIWTSAKAATKRLVVRDSGGVYTDVYTRTLYKPFQQATGIEVVGVASAAEPTAQIKSIVETGAKTWDMAELSFPAVYLLSRNGKAYLEPIKLDGNGAVAKIAPHFVDPYAVGHNVYTTVLTYRRDAFKGTTPPTSWADLWDAKKFPGRRALRKYPFDTIEEALMAAGTPTSSVYPCNLDKAFASLDRVKPNIDIWWTTGAQCEQMLKSGEVAMASSWLARVLPAIDAGEPLAVSWNGHIYGPQGFGILKGGNNVEACRQFVAFCADPKRQAEVASALAVGPTHPDAFQFIDEKRARNLPTFPDNLRRGVRIDPGYWPAHQEAALERFNEWVLR